ncbi:uncharacterized protein FIBRA_00653 [Fibroporia radiculosa]|uniref:Plasma membrane fusion protein PRM1 n=1 Tax=Fibroporia radiculosa TaxID=599839 RepID=J4I821_9APHY|nr:uncharacterized protein FIBRA_00653 [Fibroporia radiculosa]CCL98651.1 predicted protein [Fibroporia radiculosa]
MSTAPWNSVYTSPSSSNSQRALKPYLELPHLLSLTWLAYPILSLLFVAFRLQISAQSAQSSIASAKSDFISSCSAAQQAATSAASLPRYLAVAANDQISDAVNGTLDAARATLVLSLTIMEAIINFIIDMYRSTFLCFLELVVQGGLTLLISAVQEINSFLTTTLNGIRTAIQSDITSANNVIADAVNGINKINPFGNISVPQFSIPALTELENVTLPTDFETTLIKLNDSLPTLSALKSDIDSIVDTPFELLKKEINDTFAGFSFNSSVLPIPEQNTLSFCNDLDTSFIDDLGEALLKVAKIGIIILVVLALLLLGANCAFEWYKWHLLKKHLQNTRDAWTTDPSVYHSSLTKGAPTVDLSDHNLMILQADAQHPHLMKIANALARLTHMGPSQYINLRWFLHYVFHPPALACFLIGFFGLLSVEIQVIAVRPLADEFSQQAVATVNSYADVIATSINGSMYNQSSVYANSINAQVDSIQSTINDGLFGWVNGTTTTLNNTLNTFYTDLQDAVSTVFNGTILEQPVQEFIKCFIGGKVTDLEDALTFLHNNLQVDLPRVNETALVLSPSDVNEVTAPIASAAIGSGNGNSNGIVGDIVDAYISSLKAERIMFGIFMGLWGVVVVMALCIIFWYSYGRDWLEAYRRRKWKKEQRAGINGHLVPFRDATPGPTTLSSDSLGGETMVQKDIPSFDFGESPQLHLDAARYAGPSEGQHASGQRRTMFDKSWDSFVNHISRAAPVEERRTLKISLPQKLMVGRRRDPHIPDDEEKYALGSNPVMDPRPSWFTRMFGVAGTKSDDAGAEDTVVDEKGSDRARPRLTISISRASAAQVGQLPMLEKSTEDAAPKSAWSVSPGLPPKQSWANGILPAKKVGLPSNPSPHRKSAKAPHDAVVDFGGQPMPVPLHYGFERPPTSPGQRVFLPPPLHPNRLPALNPDTSTPITRLLTTTHARHSSQAVDPFVTPFDDEYRAPDTPTLVDPFSERGRRTTNPFATMAI